jgi:hypothetical protein
MNGGAIGLMTIIGCVTVFVWGNATHNWTVTWFVVVPIICAFGIALGTIIKNAPKAPPTAVNRDELPRMKQVYALLSAPCPVCRAQPGAACTDDKSGKPLALIDRKWNTLCHFKRMEKAVQYGMVSRADMIAQWNGQLPEGLNL